MPHVVSCRSHTYDAAAQWSVVCVHSVTSKLRHSATVGRYLVTRGTGCSTSTSRQHTGLVTFIELASMRTDNEIALRLSALGRQ